MTAAAPSSWRLRARQLLARPGVARGLRVLGWTVLSAYFAFVALILVLRYLVLPGVADYKPEIEQAASAAIGQPVRIESIVASWQGINPSLTLDGVRLLDRQGRPALAFERVESVLSWQTLWRFKPILALLAVEGPVLHVRRDAGGRITIAGVDAEGESDPRIAEWIFEQRRIRIRNAIIVWEDAARKAPPLVLEDLQFGLDNRGSHHMIGLSALPPDKLAARLDFRADLQGDLADGWHRLSGQVFAELEYADLAAWRTWIDYPVALRQGRGAVRLWAQMDGRAPTVEGLPAGKVTTDLALEDVRVQFGQNLPELALNTMRGRFEGGYEKGVWHFAGRQMELATQQGLRLTPTDLDVRWKAAAEGGSAGNVSASLIDFDALQQLAAYLPLDQRGRELLARHQPRGRIAELRAQWDLAGEQLKRYELKARFAGLGWRADGRIPGGEGLSGEIEASDKGGLLSLTGSKGALELPAVFPVPRIPLDELAARVAWKNKDGQSEVRIEKFDFANADAAGAFHGVYRTKSDGPGEIDLGGGLSRANGAAVWRYMPLVVNVDARDWLKRGIVSGTATDTRLTLRGDLRNFPFADKKSGEFLITTKAHNVRIDYAPGWPAIDAIDADLAFGVGMHIEARSGRIFGTRLGKVNVDLPDFASEDERLLVRGQIEGPTGEFLHFIERSPVGDAIDHFTSDMRAAGNGKLDLQLDIPLRKVDATKVQGEYRFVNNQVLAVPGLPTIAQVNGALNFTESRLTAKEITGQIFGAPMKLAIRNDNERITVALSGGLHARELRKQFDTPLFDHLSGQAAWKGEIRVKTKGPAEFVIESNLQGIASALPEPFNKPANAALPFRLEKTAVAGDASRDQIRLTVRGVGEALLQRRQSGADMLAERGSAAIGTALPAAPARGVAVAIQMPRVDADFWRAAVPNGGGETKAQSAGASMWGLGALPLRISLKTPLLKVLGRDINDLDATAASREQVWQLALNSRQVAGDLYWQGADKGMLKADLKRLLVPASATGSGSDAVAEAVDGLPGLDVKIADFALGDKHLGRLEARAHNGRAGFWQLDSLSLQNPDGGLKGKGEWRTRGGHRTRLDFELAAHDIGKLLERLGYPGAVKRGSASLKGDLAWDGPLTAIHYPSLNGKLKVSAEKGQFAKLEPGIGKLLGLLSLQSLPRRLTLDFRDVFSEGLAFDSIEADLKISGGVMRIVDQLKIDGPAARVLMQGETDLKRETQNLTVTVQPELGSVLGVAGAMALAHPVVGVGVLVANKVLQNPLNKIFSFQYHITGTWDDPKVEKTGQTVPAPVAETPPAGGKAKEGKQ